MTFGYFIPFIWVPVIIRCSIISLEIIPWLPGTCFSISRVC